LNSAANKLQTLGDFTFGTRSLLLSRIRLSEWQITR